MKFFLLQILRNRIHDPFYKLFKTVCIFDQMHFPGINLCISQHIINNCEQVIGRASDRIHIALRLTILLPFQHDLRKIDDGIHRRSDLIGHITQKLSLCCARTLDLPAAFLNFFLLIQIKSFLNINKKNNKKSRPQEADHKIRKMKYLVYITFTIYSGKQHTAVKITVFKRKQCQYKKEKQPAENRVHNNHAGHKPHDSHTISHISHDQDHWNGNSVQKNQGKYRRQIMLPESQIKGQKKNTSAENQKHGWNQSLYSARHHGDRQHNSTLNDNHCEKKVQIKFHQAHAV